MKPTISSLQQKAQQQGAHLAALQTISALYQNLPTGSTILPQVEKALLELLKPFLPQSKIEIDESTVTG